MEDLQGGNRQGEVCLDGEREAELEDHREAVRSNDLASVIDVGLEQDRPARVKPATRLLGELDQDPGLGFGEAEGKG